MSKFVGKEFELLSSIETMSADAETALALVEIVDDVMFSHAATREAAMRAGLFANIQQGEAAARATHEFLRKMVNTAQGARELMKGDSAPSTEIT